MKPLTIEELKALEIGDWVWDDIAKDYLCMHDIMGEYLDCLICGRLTRLYYSSYGKTWLAYKNKEQAKELGEQGYGNTKQAVKEFAEKIEKLICEHEKRYSHLCKSKKECHDETCRYQAILRLHKEITELYGADK